MSRNLRLLSTFLAFTFLLTLAPRLQPLALAQEEPAAAAADDDDEEEDEEEQAAKHFANGRKLKGEGKNKEAIEELLKAYKLRPAPPLLAYIGKVYQEMDDNKNALRYYKEFLQKARFTDPQRKMVASEVKKLEKLVKGSTGALTSAAGTETPEAAGELGGSRPGMRRRRLQMIHTPVDSAKVRQPITVMAELPPRLEVDEVTVHFRKGGEIKFRERKMELQGETYIARIPARFVTSTSLQYYITARKGTGKRSIVAEAGAKNAPHIVVIEGGRSPSLGPVKEEAITSPYRTWIWVSGAVAVAAIGVGAVGMALSADRQSAMEKWAQEKSCKNDCSVPQLPFSEKARDWEAEGKSFNALGWAGLIVGGVAAGATGFLWYMDRKYVKQERARRDADASPPRLMATPWVAEGSAGLVGRISF